MGVPQGAREAHVDCNVCSKVKSVSNNEGSTLVGTSYLTQFCYVSGKVTSDIQGYQCLLPTSHWWPFKTPFYNWYSKNYQTGIEPIMKQMDLSGPHVTCLLFIASCTSNLHGTKLEVFQPKEVPRTNETIEL